MRAAASARGALFSGANRIALSGAVRGTLAAAVPFLLLRYSGHPAEALFATVAALNVSIADSGGPYLQRLTVMLVIALGVPLVLVAGMVSHDTWWLAVALMFAVAFLGGLARLYGPAGTAVGLISSIVFLIGSEIPADLQLSLHYAGFYCAGAAWSILVVFLIWRLRPYRRVRYELGEGFLQLADVLAALHRCGSATGGGDEADLAAGQRRIRTTFEAARDTLGEDFANVETMPGFVSDLIVMIRAGLRINAAAASLGSALEYQDDGGLSDAARDAAGGILETFPSACRGIAATLLDRDDNGSLALARRRLEEWEPVAGAASLEEIDTLLNVILRQLESARRVADRLAEPRRHGGLLPPLHGPAFPAVSLSTVRANLSFDALVFRHALRVAVAASGATAAYLLLDIPHGMWLPLTVIIILQPQLGPTLIRALQRTGGTLLGTLLAGVLVYLFRDSAAMEAAILGCLFLTLLFFRRRYWVAVTFLTPLIILLLSLLVYRPWVEIAERLGNTLGGAALALAAAAVLWPSRESGQIPDIIAAAIDANRRYLETLFQALDRGLEPGWPLAGCRAGAERATSNARASVERLFSEPRWLRREAGAAVTAVTHVERLCRHITRLSIYLHAGSEIAPAFGDLGRVMNESLEELADAARHSRPPADYPRLEKVYASIRRNWCKQPGADVHDLAPVQSLTGNLMGDIQGLRAALAKEE